MSTESEIKSADVPAGATHVCWCGATWTRVPLALLSGSLRCWDHPLDGLRPIAEAGAAPTTAAPVDQPENALIVGQKMADYIEEQMPLLGGASSEFPGEGKARELLASWRRVCSVPAEQPWKAADPRPAQPQAPADEGWRTPFGKFTLAQFLAYLVNKFGGEGKSGWAGDLRAAADHFREHPPKVAAMREERDRLAGEVRELNARVRKDGEYRERAETGLRAQVAERDARIETLTKAARSAANGLAEWKLWMNSPRNAPAETMRQYAQAMQETERDLRAALGAPEGQPPAAPSEAPLDALRRLADKWERMAEGYRASAAGTMVSCARELRDTLSAPPPPTREKQELLGEKGAKPDGLLRAMAYARDELDGCAHGDGCCRDCLARILASMDETISLARSAPPRKAPQEGCKACALVAKEFGTDKCPWCGRPFGTTVGYVEKCSAMHHAVRSAMGLDKPAYDARPSSPEEQFSGKELK